METARKRRKAIVDEAHCVACGCCVKVCPLRSIEIVQGLTARVNEEKCVGCGKCARVCPQNIDIPGALKDMVQRISQMPSWAEICRQREAAANRK